MILFVFFLGLIGGGFIIFVFGTAALDFDVTFFPYHHVHSYEYETRHVTRENGTVDPIRLNHFSIDSRCSLNGNMKLLHYICVARRYNIELFMPYTLEAFKGRQVLVVATFALYHHVRLS